MKVQMDMRRLLWYHRREAAHLVEKSGKFLCGITFKWDSEACSSREGERDKLQELENCHNGWNTESSVRWQVMDPSGASTWEHYKWNTEVRFYLRIMGFYSSIWHGQTWAFQRSFLTPMWAQIRGEEFEKQSHTKSSTVIVWIINDCGLDQQDEGVRCKDLKYYQ